jgi:hypothetical protein
MRSLNSTWLDFVDSIEDYIKANEELEEQARIDGLQAWHDFYNMEEEQLQNPKCWSPKIKKYVKYFLNCHWPINTEGSIWKWF